MNAKPKPNKWELEGTMELLPSERNYIYINNTNYWVDESNCTSDKGLQVLTFD